MPQSRDNSVNIKIFVDTDHAGNLLTGRLYIGIMIYINMAPIILISKKRNTVETCTFGAGFIALKIQLN